MKIALVLGTMLLLLAPATACTPVEIAQGHITAGDANASWFLFGANGQPTSFTFPAPPVGSTLVTLTRDGGVGGHKLQVNWEQDDHVTLALGCYPDLNAEARCVVPYNATAVTITAEVGVNLDVTVFAEQ
jgi:hypothetical protein